MKKLFYWSVPIKSFAAMIFAGFIILYMIIVTIYAVITGEAFEYAIPFMFAIQAVAVSVVISILWTIIFSDIIIKKMRYFLRLIIFSAALLPVFALSFLVLFVSHADCIKLWLVILGAMILGLIIISLLFETYFKLIGKRYTEMLKDYKSKIN
jgi:hypothetical protein